MSLFEIRNGNDSEKRIKLNRVSDNGTIGAEKHPTVITADDKIGLCLSPARINDCVYFTELFVNNSDTYFDVEINGTTYPTRGKSFSEGKFYGDDWTPVPELSEILTFHSQGSEAWLSCTIKNQTDDLLKVKLLLDKEAVDVSDYPNISDDGYNTSIFYDPEGNFIEFTLAPRIEWDQVPEEEKFIAVVKYVDDIAFRGRNTNPTLDKNWTYLDFNFGRDASPGPRDYFCIDWGDGNGVTNYNFHEMSAAGERDFGLTWIGIYKPMTEGTYEVKLWSSLPADFFMLMNVVEVKQWGVHIHEGVYGLNVISAYSTFSEMNTQQQLLGTSYPPGKDSSCAFFDMQEMVHDIGTVYLNSIVGETIYSDPEDDGLFSQDIWKNYNAETNYVGYNHHSGKFGLKDLRYGKYPEDFPGLGFEDLDQLLLEFPTNGGTGFSVSLDWFSYQPDNMIGSFKPDQTSDAIKWFKDPVSEKHYFLLDIEKYKETKSLDKFLLAFRVWYQNFDNYSVPVVLKGWKGDKADIVDSKLINVPSRLDYDENILLPMRVGNQADFSIYGEKVGFLHYDTHENLIVPKNALGSFNEIEAVTRLDYNSLDTVFAYGYPGDSIYFPDQQEPSTFGDSGFMTKTYTTSPTGFNVASLFARPGFDFWSQTFNINTNSILDYKLELNGVVVTPEWSNHEDGKFPIVVDRSFMVPKARPQVIYRQTSEYSGETIEFKGSISYIDLVLYEQEQLLILEIPKDLIIYAYSESYLFKVTGQGAENLDYKLRFNTPGEHTYSPPMTGVYKNGSYGVFDYSYPNNDVLRWDGVADNQIVEVFLFDKTTKLPPNGTLTLEFNVGTVIQLGTMFQ